MDVPAHLAEAVATVRAFAAASGAERVVLLVDRGEEEPVAMLAGEQSGAVHVDDAGEEIEIEPGTPPGAAPRALPSLRPVPPTAVAIDPETGELEAPLGVIAHLARGVLALATAFGGRSVATADFATRDPDVPITIAAREGEPLVLAAGDRRFVLPSRIG